MKRLIPVLFTIALAVPLMYAQQGPGAFTTLQTTDTTANSVLVGCAVGSSTCTGGIKAGALAISGSAAGGVGAVITQSTSGTGNFSYMQAIAGTAVGQVTTYSQGFTTSGTAIAASSLLSNDGAGGLSLAAANAAGVIRLYTGATPTLRFQVDASGNWLNGANIMDSTGTPTYTSGFGGSATIAGKDYGFKLTPGGASTTGILNFGRTWTNAPVCVATVGATASGTGEISIATTTTTIRLDFGSSSSNPINVLCRGY